MSEIADLTYNVVAFSEIMSMVWKRLNDHGKNWRHVYKVRGICMAGAIQTFYDSAGIWQFDACLFVCLEGTVPTASIMDYSIGCS